MPKIRYQKITIRDADKLDAIEKANVLIESYQSQGYMLTLRQLYYRFVAGDLFPASRKWSKIPGTDKWVRDPNGTINAEPNYKWLGDVVSDARMGGFMDWEAIEDRTREVDEVPHWETPAAILSACHNSFRVDKWLTQRNRIEVWVEKDAVEGIAKQAAHAHDVPIFSCRGYSSLSSLWESANRLKKHIKNRQRVVILHLGDHDPSGIDMSRDIEDRLNTFIHTDLLHETMEDIKDSGLTFRDDKGKVKVDMVCARAEDLFGIPAGRFLEGKMIEVRRIALTMEQVEQYNPPPNPAKTTDARYKKYQEEHGDESWELDALEPSVLDQLIQDSIEGIKDADLYADREELENKHRKNLKICCDNWDNGLAEVVANYKPKPAKKGKKK